MGPMLLLVLGILSAVGLGLYQFGEHHRFDMASDAKGGIFIIDRKSAAINYCNDKICSLVGNGSLPSQAMGNPAALTSVQGAIMGAPAVLYKRQRRWQKASILKSYKKYYGKLLHGLSFKPHGDLCITSVHNFLG